MFKWFISFFNLFVVFVNRMFLFIYNIGFLVLINFCIIFFVVLLLIEGFCKDFVWWCNWLNKVILIFFEKIFIGIDINIGLGFLFFVSKNVFFNISGNKSGWLIFYVCLMNGW